MATQTVTVIWLDGMNQERCRTVKRKIREMPIKTYLERHWPNRYTHLIKWYGQELPATWGAGQWWAFADDA